jgi:hypothetical protein
MGDSHDADSEIDVYVKIAVEVAEGGADREAVLAGHGLSSERWDTIDDAWQARLSEASDRAGDDDGLPPLLAAYADAMARAQKARAEDYGVVALERFAQAMLLLQRGGDTAGVLKKVGLTIQEFLRASQYWTRRIVSDPEIAERFQKTVG